MQAESVPSHPLGLPLWAAWSRFLLVPPSKYRCPVCGLVALLSAWCVVCALLLLFVLTVASKAFALCGVERPSTPLCVRLSCSQHSSLRYSSLIIQDPQWTSVKVLEYPLVLVCSSSPCLVLPPGSPLLYPSCWVVPVLVSLFCPCCSACLSVFCLLRFFCGSLRMCFGAVLSVSFVGCVCGFGCSCRCGVFRDLCSCLLNSVCLFVWCCPCHSLPLGVLPLSPLLFGPFVLLCFVW